LVSYNSKAQEWVKIETRIEVNSENRYWVFISSCTLLRLKISVKIVSGVERSAIPDTI